MSQIAKHGNKVIYALEVAEKVKSLYKLKKLILLVTTLKATYLKEHIDFLIKDFIDKVNIEYEIISSDKLFLIE